jgi:hypothetical protein
MPISEHLIFNLVFKRFLVPVCSFVILFYRRISILHEDIFEHRYQALALYILDSQYFDSGIIYEKYRSYWGLHAVYVNLGIKVFLKGCI